MDPERDTVDDDPENPDDTALQRPLPPPPTIGELIEVFRRRLALRHPRFDPTRVALAVAALIGIGGMAWALWSPRDTGPQTTSGPVPTVASTTTTTVPPTTVPDDFIVDVEGAVRRPGPVQVDPTGRVEDAIRAAGGVRGDADLERVDRAMPLVDGQRVYVPAEGQTDIPQVVGSTGGAPRGTEPAPGSSTGSTPAESVNVNTADEAELITLPGVGPATAQAIIDHRDANGPFAAVDDLLGVKGIGPAKMENLRPHVTV